MAAYEGISDVAAVSAIVGLLAFGTMLGRWFGASRAGASGGSAALPQAVTVSYRKWQSGIFP